MQSDRVKKFKTELVWHNCLTCQPEERFNRELYATNGVRIYKVVYKKGVGFVGDGIFIDDSSAQNFWWADLIQTIHNTDYGVIN